jgi:NitT/TauT family transport system substrate-binding protein
MNLTRRNCLTRLLALGLLPAFAACSAAEKLVVAAHVWPGYEFLFLARDEGWFSPTDIQLLETATASESIDRLKSGEVMAATLTLDEVLLARAKGIQLTVVMVFDVSAGADKVIARPPVLQLAHLKGKRIAVETSAVGSLMLIKTLAEAGLTAKDVEVVEMTGSHADMWKSGLTDALITYDPTASQLLSKGGVSIFDSRQMPELIFDVLAVKSDALRQHGSKVRELIASHFKGVQAFRQNPADISYRLAKHLGLSGNEVPAAYRGLKMPDIFANRSYLLDENSSLQKAAQQLSSLMVTNKSLPREDSFKKLFSAEYLSA